MVFGALHPSRVRPLFCKHGHCSCLQIKWATILPTPGSVDSPFYMDCKFITWWIEFIQECKQVTNEIQRQTKSKRSHFSSKSRGDTPRRDRMPIIITVSLFRANTISLIEESSKSLLSFCDQEISESSSGGHTEGGFVVRIKKLLIMRNIFHKAIFDICIE
jgi:hypothetical protein